MPGGITALVGTALTSVGVGEATAGILSPILAGAGVGALTDLKNPLKGALGGAVTGGFSELASPFASLTGLGSGASGLLTGAAGGALGGLISGQGPASGAITGGLEGALGLGGKPSGGTGAPLGGSSAAATAAPAAAAGASPDLTGGGLFDRLGRDLGLGGGSSGGISPVTVTPGVRGENFGGVTPGATFGSNPSAPAGGGGLLESLGLKGDQILPLVGTAAAALRGPPGDIKALTAMANRFGQQGEALSSYVTNGTLPPGLDSALKQATRASVANIRGTYANLGLSGSTMEAQAVNAAEEQASAQAFSYARDLLTSGIQESGLSAQLFSAIMASQEQSDQSLMNAISGFSAAAAGGALPQGFRAT